MTLNPQLHLSKLFQIIEKLLDEPLPQIPYHDSLITWSGPQLNLQRTRQNEAIYLEWMLDRDSVNFPRLNLRDTYVDVLGGCSE